MVGTRIANRLKPWALGLFLVGCVWLGMAQLKGRSPQPADAPPERFSAHRALAHIQALCQTPHAAGTEAVRRVQTQLMDAIRQLGYDPQVFTAYSARRNGVVWTENVWVRVPGREPGKAVVLMAHYDSVPTGPGASDDGAGVASLLETLRALRHHPPLKNDLLFVITDAEEMGLLGAKAIAQAGLFKDEIGVILNFDCRGTTGPVILGQTSLDTGRLIAEYARFAPGPVTASWAMEITRHLPNATDLRPFIQNYPSMDFSFIEGHAHYHQPTDNIAQVDLASVQQMGETALGGALRFGNLDLSSLRDRDQGYYNCFWTAGPFFPGLGLAHGGNVDVFIRPRRGSFGPPREGEGPEGLDRRLGLALDDGPGGRGFLRPAPVALGASSRLFFGLGQPLQPRHGLARPRDGRHRPLHLALSGSA